MNIGRTTNGTRNVVFGILAGGAIGAAIALLYAPKKGSRLRADIRRKSGELVDNTGEMIETAIDKASDSLEQVKRGSNRAFDSARKSVQTVAEKTTHLLRHT